MHPLGRLSGQRVHLFTKGKDNTDSEFCNGAYCRTKPMRGNNYLRMRPQVCSRTCQASGTAGKLNRSLFKAMVAPSLNTRNEKTREIIK